MNPPYFESSIPQLRYHAPASDDLFRPIAFGFVTEQMCAEILAERQHILNLIPESRRARQTRLLDKYDPQRSADLFRSILRPFLAEHCDSPAV
jgi:hypothetical protein